MAEAWAKKAVEGFKFCPKFFRSISHYKRLKGAEEVTEAFLYIMNSFGNNLGPCFLQLPDNFTPSKFNDLENFLKLLPTDIQVAVELRHTGWFTDDQVADELFNMMKENSKALVITDTAGRRDCVHQRLTNNLAFIRFNGYDLHQSDFQRMDEWIEKIINRKHDLNRALKNNYMNHPEPVEENWNWDRRGRDWIYSKWLYETRIDDLYLLKKIFVD